MIIEKNREIRMIDIVTKSKIVVFDKDFCSVKCPHIKYMSNVPVSCNIYGEYREEYQTFDSAERHDLCKKSEVKV